KLVYILNIVAHDVSFKKRTTF
ncbi:MAG: hypothetical protein QG617_1022, partial [Campylobacterota bacterium]|nr:hypothetical protein [Campylobacterota bacterium]